VVLEDELGNSFSVAIEAIGQRIRGTVTQLVYLDACETQQTSMNRRMSLSQTLTRSGVGAVVAMQFSINDDSALIFSERFYHYLLKGAPICKAVTEARIALLDFKGKETIDWAIPVLNMRSDYEFVLVGDKAPRKRLGSTTAPPRFVGRAAELDQLAEKLLTPSCIILVHGFGGIGKSTLVQKILSEIGLLFEDTCFIDCRGVKSISEVIHKIYPMLSINGFPVVDEELRRLNEYGKMEYVCGQIDKARFLIILDNVDEMLDDTATKEFVSHVGRFSKAKLLVSCRIQTSLLDSQREMHVSDLEPKYAIALIRQIGQDIPRIRDALESDLVRIYEKLGGHPYSIVIAVPLFSAMPFEQILADLPARVSSVDEQTSRILEWSFGKLNSEEQRFLENASIFAGEVPMEALIAINDGCEDALIDLVKKNMIEFDQLQLYSLHPLLREYAYKKLGDRRDDIQIKAAEEIGSLFEPEFWSEAISLYELAVDSAKRKNDDMTLLSVLTRLGNVYFRIGEYEKAKNAANTGLMVAQKLENQLGIAITFHQLGIIEFSRGDYGEAKKLHNKSLDIYRKLGNQSGIANALHELGILEQAQGNNDKARKLYNETLGIQRKLGNQPGIASALYRLGTLEQAQHNYGDAKVFYTQSLQICRRFGDLLGIAEALHQLGLLSEDLETAERLCEEARRIFEKIGTKPQLEASKDVLDRIKQLKDKP